ncbi:hypothetical protein [Sanyastnella coralliicola]|uniref:hypothetical protein n=1 Tax=Sanyastnella coralliicola TaxID=3069118 RepID=UPI0027B89C98|nr:hypothetical protein [Longitalea sp. SCSIO 12813]
MYRFLLLLAFGATSLHVYTQENLVPNGSFEEFIDCPVSTTELATNCLPWETWQLTPDFFHECGEVNAGVPDNAWGSQEAFHGSAYACFITYETIDESREYMATALTSPLEVGEEYRIEFSISFVDGGLKSGNLAATNNIGFRFFQDPDYDQLNELQPDNFAHFNIDTLVIDQTNWLTLEVFFTADQPYDYIAFGNFFDDENTEVWNINSSGYAVAFYYIDAICVQKSEFPSCYPVNVVESSSLDLNFIYSTGQLMISGLDGKDSLISVYTVEGKLLSHRESNDSSVIFEDLPSNGIVIVQAVVGEEVISRKLFLQ